MTLVDTSVWIEHFRTRQSPLVDLLNSESVLMHPFVIGELACGTLPSRTETLQLLRALPRAAVATEEEVLQMIENRRLMGRAIGYVDAHLLAAAIIGDTLLWTFDASLHRIAVELGVSKRGSAVRH